MAAGVSVECDLECLPTVLRVFARAFEAGFGDLEIERLARVGEQLDSGERYRSRLTVQVGGLEQHILVELTAEDQSTIQVCMESTAPVIEVLEKLLPNALAVAAADSSVPTPSGADDLDKHRQQLRAETAAASAPILKALREAGFNVQSFEELKNNEHYRQAVPFLLDWLERTSQVGVKCAVLKLILDSGVRPMPYSRMLSAWERTATHSSYEELRKWDMAAILSNMAEKLPLDDLLRVVKDKRQGKARQMLVIGLGRVKNPRAVATLMELLMDGDLVSHALEGLRKHNAREAIPLVKRYVTSDNALIRREAKKTLVKLEKSLSMGNLTNNGDLH